MRSVKLQEGKKIKNRRKKIRISIGNKLILIISLIIIVSLSTMIILASYFFKEDNEVRIKENNLKISEILALKVKTDFTSILKLSNLLLTTLINENPTKEQVDIISRRFFAKDKELIFIGIAEKDKKDSIIIKHSITNTEFLRDNDLTPDKMYKSISAEKEVFIKSFNTEQIVNNISPFLKIPVIGISVPFVKKTEASASSILIIYVSMNRFLEAVKSPGITKTFIVNGNGDLIAHHDSSLVLAKVNVRNLPIIKMMMKSTINNGQTRYNDEKGINYLGSFRKLAFADIGVIATVQEDKAFEAVYKIQKRNILITIIVLNLAILIVYFFAKTLSNPITRLVKATREIEEGNFDIRIEKMPSDEIGLLSRSFIDMGKGLAEREKMKDAFGKFVNKEIAEMVLRDEVKLGGERKNVAIFFSDIRSFTAISEKLQPEEVVEFLNQYMTRMVDCVYKTNGVVDKFIGDALMATWGAPVSHGNDTENAINSSILMRKSLMEFNKDRDTEEKPMIRIGCGINTGPALAGQIGSQDRMEYTVIGDAVNLASRIEALNKPFGTDILISGDSYKLIEEIFKVEKMKQIMVKGKEEPQQIYAVLGQKDDPECPASVDELRKILGIEAKDLSDFDPDKEEDKFEIIG